MVFHWECSRVDLMVLLREPLLGKRKVELMVERMERKLVERKEID
jgi:hypothetical protein